MKGFVSGFAAMVIIAVAAWIVLGQVDMSAQDVFKQEAVRL